MVVVDLEEDVHHLQITYHCNYTPQIFLMHQEELWELSHEQENRAYKTDLYHYTMSCHKSLLHGTRPGLHIKVPPKGISNA